MNRAWPKVSKQIIDSFVKNLGRRLCNNIQSAYHDSVNVHAASTTINFNAQDFYSRQLFAGPES
jgi:hypothetical protein